MSIQSRRIFGDPQPSGSSGDGASQDGPTDPNTGAGIPGYVPPTASDRMDTTGALGDTTAHGDVHEYEITRRSFSGVDHDADSNMTACGVELGSSGRDDFHTTGSAPDQNPGYGIAGTDPLVTRAAGADTGEDFGKVVG